MLSAFVAKTQQSRGMRSLQSRQEAAGGRRMARGEIVVDTRFRVGDLVKLRSGGPVMTVSDVPDPQASSRVNATEYECVWFSGAKINSARFPAEVLDAAEPPAQGHAIGDHAGGA
jgi:uncharacterized protein YodC (DUF2158 family)